ncbi:S41 family peptidase [Parapedobacter koreensis]|uniref:C-terminal processing peptidase-3. Serine peptidase. MEROPS family S41A n=1 Tax=Parapedobacter koreensis TaxID=332977 RepID=A0A1H7QQS4_9SPHI|nr:S41 family peptidase [Parapedobacter koreensis]SEL50283.1 C-terminal processing peptidase-3. Serine peptidase. MEROPS family S41A [Parapedobacter koreensis]
MNYHKHLLSAKRFTALAVTLLFFSAFAAVNDDLFLISKNLDIFSAVYRQISLNYVDETDPNTLIKTAVDAMLGDLDPYTEYVQETDIEDYRLKYVDTRYGGIGAAILVRGGHIYISELYAGQPADQAGIQTGDELVSINGVLLKGKTTAEVSHLLRGAEHSNIRLQIRKPGQDKPEELAITRSVIRQPNVSHIALLDGGIGYIKLDKFLEQSANEVEKALHGLQQKGKMNGLIIDLRNNGGGILQEAVKIVNLFVPEGELVVSQKGKNASKTYSYRTMAKPVASEIPLTVLVNGYSASAAEIVAGALQDLDRAVIVGERSFGKGLVQQTFNLPYNNLVKVTVAKYYTPSGRCIQAVDFIHRDSNGDYTRVSDSLINAFYTKKGRVVYDGSGIYPDITVEKIPYNAITQTLLSRYLIFDYATAFKQQHPQIPNASTYTVNDAQYKDFIQFLEGKDYDYFTEIEALLQQLKIKAEVEKKPEEILNELASLARKVYVGKQHDLTNYQEEIKEALGSEIVSRYYYKDGRTTFSLKYDAQLQRARSLLIAPTNEYYSILAGEGEYKTIGGPETLLAVAEINQ